MTQRTAYETFTGQYFRQSDNALHEEFRVLRAQLETAVRFLSIHRDESQFERIESLLADVKHKTQADWFATGVIDELQPCLL